jgi:hypothetical protein
MPFNFYTMPHPIVGMKKAASSPDGPHFLCFAKESGQRKATRAVRRRFAPVPCGAHPSAGAAELARAAPALRQSSPSFRCRIPLLGELYGTLWARAWPTWPALCTKCPKQQTLQPAGYSKSSPTKAKGWRGAPPFPGLLLVLLLKRAKRCALLLLLLPPRRGRRVAQGPGGKRARTV